MEDLKLASNEGIIIQSTDVLSGTRLMDGYTDDLILTNLNIILIKRGVFGKKKSEQRFPVSDIKIINNKPQVMMSKMNSRNVDQLQIDFKNGIQHFEFSNKNKKEIAKWIKSIHELLNCKEDGTTMDVVTDSLKKGVDSIKQIFGIKTDTKNTNDPQTQFLTARCHGCKAPLKGTRKQIVRCSYCDTEHTF